MDRNNEFISRQFHYVHLADIKIGESELIKLETPKRIDNINFDVDDFVGNITPQVHSQNSK